MTTFMECIKCEYKETWTHKEDVSYNFEVCGVCEDRYCLDCIDSHECANVKLLEGEMA